MASLNPFHALAGSSIRRADSRGHLDVLYEQGNVVLKGSFSRAGVFRGLHWQAPPHGQLKLIRVVCGEIRDFVADSSMDRPTLFHKRLTPAHGWVQIGEHLAHGFLALSDCEFEYLCHGAYCETAEKAWSITDALRSLSSDIQPMLSAKDQAAAPMHVGEVVCLD